MLKLYNALNPRSVKYFDTECIPCRLMLSQCQTLLCQGNYPLAIQHCPSMIFLPVNHFAWQGVKAVAAKMPKVLKEITSKAM